MKPKSPAICRHGILHATGGSARGRSSGLRKTGRDFAGADYLLSRRTSLAARRVSVRLIVKTMCRSRLSFAAAVRKAIAARGPKMWPASRDSAWRPKLCRADRPRTKLANCGTVLKPDCDRSFPGGYIRRGHAPRREHILFCVAGDCGGNGADVAGSGWGYGEFGCGLLVGKGTAVACVAGHGRVGRTDASALRVESGVEFRANRIGCGAYVL